MIRNEWNDNGVIVYAEVIDLEAGTLTVEENGLQVSTRPLTADEVELFTVQPDHRESAIAKLQSLGLTETEALALIRG